MREVFRKSGRLMFIMTVCFAGGACVVFGAAPAATAVYIVGSSLSALVLLPYICVVCGIAIGALGAADLPFAGTYIYGGGNYDGVGVLEKYAVLLAVLMAVMKVVITKGRREKKCAEMPKNPLQTPGLTAFAAIGILAANLLTFGAMPVVAAIYTVVDVISTLCFVNILRPGMEYLGVGADSRGRARFDENQLIISLIFSAALVLWILPSDIYMGINPQLMLAVFLVMYTVHRAGAAYGFGLAAACGMIVSVNEKKMEWVVWMLLIALVMMIGRAIAGRGKGVTAVFYVLGVILSALSGQMDVIGMSVSEFAVYCVNLCVPAVAILCTPRRALGTVYPEPDGACMQAAATEMNRLTAVRMEEMANTFRRLDYTFAGSGAPSISLSRVGELMDGFREQITGMGRAVDVTDEGLICDLRELGMEDITVTRAAEKGGRDKFYVAGRAGGDGIVLSRQVAEVLGSHFGKNIRAGMNAPSLFFDEYKTVVYEENAVFKGRYYVRRIKKYGSPVSGDNFSVKEYEDGRLVMMLSDGMGSGSAASCESCMMLDTMEELLEAGLDPEYSISFANGCLSRKNMGRTFTTFDMMIIDMYSGRAVSYKQGASPTYILHPGDGENVVEKIESTTLPIGILEDAECDASERTLAAGDAVVMISDGVQDVDTDGRLDKLLGAISVDDSRRLVDGLIGRLFDGDCTAMRDDVTVMAVVMGDAE